MGRGGRAGEDELVGWRAVVLRVAKISGGMAQMQTRPAARTELGGVRVLPLPAGASLSLHACRH